MSVSTFLQVLLGRWKGALVAVKVLRESVCINTATKERFREEATNLERLRHSNVLDFYGACLDGQQVSTLAMHLATCRTVSTSIPMPAFSARIKMWGAAQMMIVTEVPYLRMQTSWA